MILAIVRYNDEILKLLIFIGSFLRHGWCLSFHQPLTFNDILNRISNALNACGWWKKTPTTACYFCRTPATAEDSFLSTQTKACYCCRTPATAKQTKIQASNGKKFQNGQLAKNDKQFRNLNSPHLFYNKCDVLLEIYVFFHNSDVSAKSSCSSN